MGRVVTPPEERFWAKVDRRGPNECWPWTAGLISSGYGGFHPAKDETVTAHRFAYEQEHGPGTADGMFVDHTCHNDQDCPPGPCEHRLCCNPAHLEAVTNRVNVNRSHNSNIRKTHCPKGHPYTPENTRIHVKPNTTGRSCMECARIRDSKRDTNAARKRRRAEELRKAA